MARSERLALLGGLAAAVVACNLIAGLGSFQDVSCDPCDAGLDGTADDADAAVDGNDAADSAPAVDAGAADADATADAAADASDSADASDAEASAPLPPDGATSPDYRWALWTMPNGAEAGLPNPASYTPTDAGAILDNTTRLIWGNVQPGITTFDGGASAACHYPWRLPTRIELVSILDTSQSSSVLVNPIFTTVFPTLAASAAYWTASVYANGDVGKPWTVSLAEGTIGYTETGTAVICVQSSASDGGAP